MHRCSSAQGNILGPCTCGLFHSQSNSSFSMLFSMPPNHNKPFEETSDMYYSNFTSSSSSSSSSSSVDCTLSLGTPSTRLSNDDHYEKQPTRHERRPSSCMSNFCWDILQSKHNSTPSSSASAHKTSRGGGNGNSNTNTNTASDPLVARRCANCDTTSTPLWRNGPRGPKSLCNACGIRFKKEERRASAATNTPSTTTNSSSAGGVMEAQHNNPWAVHHYSQSQKIPCLSPGNEFRFIEDDAAADSGIPFLSWRLNVTDRPSLVHDFTR